MGTSYLNGWFDEGVCVHLHTPGCSCSGSAACAAHQCHWLVRVGQPEWHGHATVTLLATAAFEPAAVWLTLLLQSGPVLLILPTNTYGFGCIQEHARVCTIICDRL